MLFRSWKTRDAADFREEVEHLARTYGYERMRVVPREEARRLCGSEVFEAGLLDEGSLHLHPLNYALGLAAAAERAGVRLHEGSRVLSYAGKDRVRVKTAQGDVDAAHVVLACNGYLGDLEPRIAGRIMPINNFILATEIGRAHV